MAYPISKHDIIEILKRDKALLMKRFGVVTIGLFGSYAAEMQHEDSDIDILVELTEPRFEFLAGLQDYLESQFNHSIDIVRYRKSLSSEFIQKVESQLINV